MLSLCEKPRIVIIARIVIAAAVETDSRTRSVHALGGLRAMAHRWMDESLPVYPGTVKEGYLVKSPPLDKRGVKVGIYTRPARACGAWSIGARAPAGRRTPAVKCNSLNASSGHTSCGCMVLLKLEISVCAVRYAV